MKKKIFLIDGNAFCYRAFYAIRGLTTSKGVASNAVYGFVVMLNKLISEHHPEYLGVAFDLKGPTFRHDKFADYKIHRKPMPDQLRGQFPLVKKVLQAWRISVFEQRGYEADDLIATLAKKLSGPGREVLIVTTDKDILQIVDGSIKLINPQKDNLVQDLDWIKQKYGIEPRQIVDVMALSGDQSDNVPGVPGIGEATAIGLIRRFGSLEQVLKNTEQIRNSSQAKKIKEFSDQAQMSKELVSLELNVPFLAQQAPDELLRQLRLTEPDNDTLFNIFKDLEFKSLMQTVARKFQDQIDYRVVSNAKELERLLEKVQSQNRLILYLGSDQENPMLAKIKSLCLALGDDGLIDFPSPEQALVKLKPVLEDARVKKIGHDLKSARLVMANYGINLAGLHFDTMVAAYLLNPARLKYGLSDLALEYLNCKLDDSAEPAHSQMVSIVLRLSEILERQLRQKDLLSLFENIEMPLVASLSNMEREGVRVDRALLAKLSEKFDQRLTSLTKEIYELAGEEFNINSPKQLSAILFEKLQLPRIKRTKTGSSTDTEVLKRLTPAHPIAQGLLEFREVSKLKSTYVDGMLKLLHPRTDKIHTYFNQTGTATGRLSSRSPNLQNIPIKTKLGSSIRQIFIPNRTGDLLLSADYSQIELRILAHLSEDENLIKAFKQDLDVHTLTACLIFDKDSREITRQMRSCAKTVNFGIIYGISAYGLARDLSLSPTQAEQFIDAYFKKYPGVKRYIQQQIEGAERDGYVSTLLRRRRYIPEISSSNESERQFAQRVAVNAPVQGSASDLIKAAMVEIDRILQLRRLRTKMIIQVHDELVFSLPPAELSEARELIKTAMEGVIKLKVSIKVSMKTGKNWLEME